MMLFLVFAGLLVSSNGFVLPSVPRLEGKIVGGTPAAITEAPYQVALLYNRGLGTFDQACGGSIISASIIVSATQCTYGTAVNQWRIRAGSTYHNSGGQIVDVGRITQHSGYTSTLENDIALLVLTSSLVLSTSVAVINLPYQGQIITDGSSAIATGWGTLSDGGPTPTNLYKVTIPTINQLTCVSAYSGFNTVTASMLCAGFISVGGYDTCMGDTGGPLVINGLLMGITSWGRGCGLAGSPGVWTRVPSFVSWIQSNS